MMRFFPLSLRAGFSVAARAALVVMAIGFFGACNRHSAEEVPENYGHGSSHRRDIPDHQADSAKENHFSDTAGLPTEEARKDSHLPPGATPAASVTNKGF